MKTVVRGFSLIEMMLVVSILAILAAIAVPAMNPQVDQAKLEGNAETVAALLGRAQAEAMASKRCVRVVIVGAEVVAQRLNAFDCDTKPDNAPKIEAGAPLWIELGRARLDSDLMTVGFDPAPSETTATALAALGHAGEVDQLRFRPSGRLWSADTDISDDDGVIEITYEKMPATALRTKKILVEAQGLICVLPRGRDPAGTGNNLTCPGRP